MGRPQDSKEAASCLLAGGTHHADFLLGRDRSFDKLLYAMTGSRRRSRRGRQRTRYHNAIPIEDLGARFGQQKDRRVPQCIRPAPRLRTDVSILRVARSTKPRLPVAAHALQRNA